MDADAILALRALVVLRKVTFGQRTRQGGERMAVLMTVANTAHRRAHRVSTIFLSLLTHPPNKVLRQFDATA